jgi:hypothetical protein
MDQRSKRTQRVHEDAIAFQKAHAEHAREQGRPWLAAEAERRAEAAARRLEREREAERN